MIVPVIVIMAVRMLVIVRMVMIVFVVDVFHARRHRHIGRGLRIEHLAEQQHEHGARQREQRDQPDQVEKVHALTI